MVFRLLAAKNDATNEETSDLFLRYEKNIVIQNTMVWLTNFRNIK